VPDVTRVYYDPLWLRQTHQFQVQTKIQTKVEKENENVYEKNRGSLPLSRALRAIPVARGYGSGLALLETGDVTNVKDISLCESLHCATSGTSAAAANCPEFLTEKERVLARHRAIAGMITVYSVGGSAGYPQSSIVPRKMLAIHVPSWDWDSSTLEGDASLFLSRLDTPRGGMLFHRLGESCVLENGWVFDEPAMIASAAEMMALALEAASLEAQRQGKQAHVKLSPLGAYPTLQTPDGLHVGFAAHKCFWQGVKLALSRCSLPGIVSLESSEQYPYPWWQALEMVQTHIQLVKTRPREIFDFSGFREDILCCIVVPGSSFQLPGGNHAFAPCLESLVANNSDFGQVCSPKHNPALLLAENWVEARQPSEARPYWWPPISVREKFFESAES
jgi:hypothetical protein